MTPHAGALVVRFCPYLRQTWIAFREPVRRAVVSGGFLICQARALRQVSKVKEIIMSRFWWGKNAGL